MTEAIFMEDYFNPGFKNKNSLHVGSQTMKFFYGNPKEQAYEIRHLAAGVNVGDLVVVRNLDPDYLNYWNSLVGITKVLNIQTDLMGEFLSKIILEDRKSIEWIQQRLAGASKLMVFLPTYLEKKLALRLNIPLHGSPEISDLYGTKSGIRQLSDEFSIPMSKGFVCKNYQDASRALKILSQYFDFAVIKHDLSTGGGWSKQVSTAFGETDAVLDEVSDGQFVEGEDIVVVEGWVKSSDSLCAHIEIMEDKDPIVCAGWSQRIDLDGISYIGAQPLQVSQKTLKSFLSETQKLAFALKQKGAVGSYSPDFLVVSEEEKNFEPESCLLLELNARVPATAFPLEIAKKVRGTIGEGFCSQHIKLAKPASFMDVSEILESNHLLIKNIDDQAHGVVPYNIGLLRWGILDVVAMGSNLEETFRILDKVSNIFKPGIFN